MRDQGRVINKSVYLALGVRQSGHKEILGQWIAETESSKFWLSALTELKNRGIKDVFFCCIDGLKGFAEAVQVVFPKTQIQLCIVHIVRNLLRYVSTKDRKEVAKDLKEIYNSPTLEQRSKSSTYLQRNGLASIRALRSRGEATGII